MPWLICALAFTSCGPGIETMEAPINQPEQFSFSGNQVVPDKWWTTFEDPALNTIVDSALTSNLDIAAVWQQFQAAQAVVQRENSSLWPQVNASLRTASSRPEPDFAGGENLQAGVTASYELDLWGRIRSGIQAEEFRAEASFYDYQAAAMSLSAEISMVWYQIVTAKKQLELIDQQIKTNEDVVRLIRARFTSGQIRAVDILRQEQLLESTRSHKILYERDLVLLKNQLAILLGRPPQNDLKFNAENLPELSQLPDTGLPLELIRRRPDVLQAYQLVMAADRDMAQAIASKYPRLSLDLSAQMRSNNYTNLFQDWAYTLAGELVAPLLYAGRLRAEVDRTEAVQNQLLYQYGQIVLNAFREVEDALIREKKQEERLEVLQRQLELAKKTNQQLRTEFLHGMIDYLEVLLSLDQEQQLQRDLLDARQIQIENRIALYRALAGGFEPYHQENP